MHKHLRRPNQKRTQEKAVKTSKHNQDLQREREKERDWERVFESSVH